MSTHEPGGPFDSGSSAEHAGSNYDAEGQDPVNLFAESGYGDPSGYSGQSAFGGRSDHGDQPGLGDQDTTSVLSTFNRPAGTGLDDDSYGSARRSASDWHGGADFGLLVLRIVIGGTFAVYGLQHLFGLFHGTGVDSFGKFLQTAGYHYPTIMAWVGGGVELVGGAMLVLGLFTPVAAGALLALVSNVIVLKWPLGFFAANGYQFQLILAGAAFAVLFTGPGRVSLDRPTPWYRHPVLNGFIFLIIGAAASVGVLLLLRTHG
ncbi:MAG TPA: DoxX family protein [Pseudonocardiaceae bacterium]|nr:DoxX family protein [Pseudonocardiaceae bacterium]